jgi:hypothetical protein
MKKIINTSLSLALLFLMGTGCEKEAEKIADFSTVSSGEALLKINFVSAYTANPSVHLKLNDVRVSNLITARTPFPGGGYNTAGDSRPDYLSVNPGSIKLSAAIPNRNTANDSIVLFNSTISLAANKNYTAHITDTGANTKVVLLTDDISMPDTGTARYTFVHLMPNVAALDLYHNNTLVASNVPYLGSVVFNRPTRGASPIWNVRQAGTGAAGTVLATYSSTNTVLARRGYTVFALGYNGLLTTAPGYTARRPYVSFLLNK